MQKREIGFVGYVVMTRRRSIKTTREVHRIMKALLKAHPNSEGRRRWIWVPVLALLTLFVVASAFLPLRARSARSTPVKSPARVYPSARSVAPPPAPVRKARALDDGIVIEGGGTSFRCGGAGCRPYDLECTAQGTYIVAVTGCCAQCCWNGTENCSSINCCAPQ